MQAVVFARLVVSTLGESLLLFVKASKSSVVDLLHYTSCCNLMSADDSKEGRIQNDTERVEFSSLISLDRIEPSECG